MLRSAKKERAFLKKGAPKTFAPLEPGIQSIKLGWRF
jgi:hypothetical protein